MFADVSVLVNVSRICYTHPLPLSLCVYYVYIYLAFWQRKVPSSLREGRYISIFLLRRDEIKFRTTAARDSKELILEKTIQRRESSYSRALSLAFPIGRVFFYSADISSFLWCRAYIFFFFLSLCTRNFCPVYFLSLCKKVCVSRQVMCHRTLLSGNKFCLNKEKKIDEYIHALCMKLLYFFLQPHHTFSNNTLYT